MPTSLPLRAPEPDAVARWLAGESPPEEAVIVRAWVEAEDTRRRTANGLKALDDAGRRLELDLDAMWSQLETRLTGQSSSGTFAPKAHRTSMWAALTRSQKNLPTSGIARVGIRRGGRAALFAPVIGGVMALALVAVSWNSIQNLWRSRHAVPLEYRTGVAQRLPVKLPDGSQVTLAPNSRMSVRPNFDQDARELTLEGEAYFDVVSSHRTPFIIHSGRLTTRVLGTAFNVRAYPGDEATEIAVVNGRVAVQRIHAARPHVILDAGMVGRVNDSTTLITEQSDASRYGDWRSGKLVFHNAPLGDVLDVLGRWYGLDFRIVDTALESRHITVTISGQSVPEMMLFLKRIVGVSMTFEGKDDRIIKLYQAPVAPKVAKPRTPRDSQLSQPKEVGR